MCPPLIAGKIGREVTREMVGITSLPRYQEVQARELTRKGSRNGIEGALVAIEIAGSVARLVTGEDSGENVAKTVAEQVHQGLVKAAGSAAVSIISVYGSGELSDA